MIPEGTTHVWTPATQTQYIGLYFRRAYYHQAQGSWFSYSLTNKWVLSSNDPEWFEEETAQGYFVPIEVFNSPTFTPRKEEV